jgi:flotillin
MLGRLIDAAGKEGMMEPMNSMFLWAIGAMVLVIAVLMVVMLKRYQKVGPNQAMIIYGGAHGRPKVVIGGGAFVIPVIQRAEILNLEAFPVEISSPVLPTSDGKSLFIDAVAQVKVQGTEQAVLAAAERFLGSGREKMVGVVQGILQNQLRAVTRQMQVAEIDVDRTRFIEKVKDLAASDLASLGLEVLVINVREVRGARK